MTTEAQIIKIWDEYTNAPKEVEVSWELNDECDEVTVYVSLDNLGQQDDITDHITDFYKNAYLPRLKFNFA